MNQFLTLACLNPTLDRWYLRLIWRVLFLFHLKAWTCKPCKQVVTCTGYLIWRVSLFLLLFSSSITFWGCSLTALLLLGFICCHYVSELFVLFFLCLCKGIWNGLLKGAVQTDLLSFCTRINRWSLLKSFKIPCNKKCMFQIYVLHIYTYIRCDFTLF